MQPKNSNIHFAPEEDQQLLDLLAAEASWPLIAVTLKRSIQALQERARKLGASISPEGEPGENRP
jgi:hypothetical protein